MGGGGAESVLFLLGGVGEGARGFLVTGSTGVPWRGDFGRGLEVDGIGEMLGEGGRGEWFGSGGRGWSSALRKGRFLGMPA